MRVNWIAFLWGFAEATLFFIVPEVWLSYCAKDSLRKGLRACAFSLIGALLGGALMYFWGRADLRHAIGAVEMVPSISLDMMDYVYMQLSKQPGWAIFLGSLAGIPSKTYAAQAHAVGLSLWFFLLISIPARLIRFVIVTIATHYSLRSVVNAGSKRSKTTLLLTGWAIFYGFYFYKTIW